MTSASNASAEFGMTPGALRIGIIIQHFPPRLGGAERQASLLAGELAGRGNSVQVVTTRHDRALASHSSSRGVSVWRLPTVAPRWLKHPVNLVMGCYAGLRIAAQVDVFHAHCLSPFVLGALLAAKLRRRPILIKICSMGPAGDVSRVKVLGLAYPLWPIYRLADRFVAPIPAVADELMGEGCHADRVSIIPNLLAEQGAPETPQGRSSSRRQLGLPDRTTLIYVGRLHRGKGLAALMRVWPEVVRIQDVQLLLVGEGPEREAIEQWRRRPDLEQTVILTGYRDDPDPYYRAADIFVSASTSETFGNAIVEAMSHGLAVVTTRVGVVEGWPAQAPVLRFEPDDTARLTELLAGLIIDRQRCANLGRDAAEFIRGQFGARHVSERYLTEYRTLLHDSQRPH